MVPIWNNDRSDGNVKKYPLLYSIKLSNKNSYIYYFTKEDIPLVSFFVIEAYPYIEIKFKPYCRVSISMQLISAKVFIVLF